MVNDKRWIGFKLVNILEIKEILLNRIFVLINDSSALRV